MAAPLPEGRDVSVPLEQIMVRALWLSVGMLIAPLVLFWAVHGSVRLFGNFDGWQFSFWAVVLILLHELCHAVGWVYWGRLRWSDIAFGFKWRALAPYTLAMVPMSARAYRLGAMLPGVLTGLLPFAVALVLGNGMWAVLGAALISGAVGDVVVLWVMRDVPPDALVRDHPENAGCIVVQEGSG